MIFLIKHYKKYYYKMYIIIWFILNSEQQIPTSTGNT